MSYILDALKKSEQQRGHGSAPGIQTTHSSGLNYYASKNSVWPYLLIGAVAINLAALFYFIGADSGENPAAVIAETTVTPVQPAMIRPVAPQPARTTKSIPRPAIEPSKTEAVAMQQLPVTRPKPASSNTTTAPVERDELPFEVKQHIPVMEFSAHVYSSNPLQRSIVINGRFLEEGDHFATDLILSEITPDGAIFDFQGHLFHQDIVTSWN